MVVIFLAAQIHDVRAQPPGAPGIAHTWAPAWKQAIGAAYEPKGAASPVWFTVAQGILTEVFYPSVDRPQIGDLQFLVSDGVATFSEQKRDLISKVSYSDEGMGVVIEGEDKNGLYELRQEIVADPRSPVVRIHARIRLLRAAQVYILLKPAIDGRGSANYAEIPDGTTLTAFRKGGSAAALASSIPFETGSVGYVGTSDGWQDLSHNFRLTHREKQAGPGNVALTAQLDIGKRSVIEMDFALGFGSSVFEAQSVAKLALREPFARVRDAYEQGWKNYLEGLSTKSLSPESRKKLGRRRFLTESTFARRSLQIIKMHEDKSHRGAIVASLSSPAIPDGDRAPEDNTGGYHLVWPRDLYHAAMGLLAAGDIRTARSVAQYLASIQKPDGSWHQNTWVNGAPYWKGLQLDETAYPILLISKLSEIDSEFMLTSTYKSMVRKAAAFLVDNGPKTQQERWEEAGGYSPSTLAAEIAALREASRLLDDPSFERVGNTWESSLESWTLVPEGQHGKEYYLRISPSGRPDLNERYGIANGGGMAGSQEILDGGFLELVRLGVRTAIDPRIRFTLEALEKPSLKIASRWTRAIGQARLYGRYNRDGYGLNHKGGYWPILAGERGHYAIAASDSSRALAQLNLLEDTATSTGLIPEQWDIKTEGGKVVAQAPAGVACPLVWAHAEDIRLHWSLEEEKLFDTPVSAHAPSSIRKNLRRNGPATPPRRGIR